MKRASLIHTLLFFAISIFAQNTENDTLTVESKGYGETRGDAIKDAIRNATETSVGMLISSNTLIENYIMVKDEILTSANAYVYRYEEKESSFDENADIYSVSIKAFVAKNLLMENTSAKVNSNLKLDMSAVEKAKFEMQQIKDRANSAIVFLGAFVQKRFRDVFIAKVDSFSLTNKNFIKMTADVKVFFTVDVKNYDNFMKEYLPLAERVRNFSDKSVETSIDIGIECSREEQKEEKPYRQFKIKNEFYGQPKKNCIEKTIYFRLLDVNDKSIWISKNLLRYSDDVTNGWESSKKFPAKIVLELGSLSLDDIDKYNCAIDFGASLSVYQQDYKSGASLKLVGRNKDRDLKVEWR